MPACTENEINMIPPIPCFESKIPNEEWAYTYDAVHTLQMNVGRLCNLSCKHCHVSCGPDRKEIMPREVAADCLRAVISQNIQTLDITGGAPEMNPSFRWLLENAAKTGVHTIVRTNLVILDAEGFRDIPELYAKYGVEVVCSLPYYTRRDNDRQRGGGVFDKSVTLLRRLNELGYGRDERLHLNLVYNPGGAFLPPSQSALERDYKARLMEDYGIVFNSLYTITNNPVGRFREFLDRSGNFCGYMERLYNSFNPGAVENMMCRGQISVDWQGYIYDCDFNQALGLRAEGPATIGEWAGAKSVRRRIRFGSHCYACTAGSGSSCGGATKE